MAPEANLLALIGSALFHAVTHTAVDDLKIRVEHFLHRPELLRNGDVEAAIQKAATVAARRLRADYKRDHPADVLAVQAFDALENALANIRDRERDDPEEPKPEAWLSPKHVAASVSRLLDGLVPYAPVRVRSFLEERFPPLFVFAFREIGLKANETVRTVVFESILHGLADSDRRIEALGLKSHEGLGSGLDALKRIEALVLGNDETLTSGLEDLGYEISLVQATVADVLNEIRGLKVLIDARMLGDGPILACVQVNDIDGNLLRIEPVRTKKFFVGRGGRDRNIAVSLDDTKVSRVHAEFIIDGSDVLVNDRNSKHGTIVGGVRIEGQQRIGFGTFVEIGPFQLRVVGPEAKELMTPLTGGSQ